MANAMSVNPYEEADRLSVEGAGSREIESWALLELAKRLDRVRKEQKQAKDPAALSEIVRLNWRAWTIIQSSLLDESNPLSPELRGDLLTLCAFIDKHSTQLLSSPDASKVQILIDINMHLGQGLRGERLSDAEQKVILQARAETASKENEKNESSEKENEKENKKSSEKNMGASAPKASEPQASETQATEPQASETQAVKKEARKVETGIAIDL